MYPGIITVMVMTVSTVQYSTVKYSTVQYSTVHWNLGSTHWQRKLEKIEALILEKVPDLLFISEANLMADIPDNQRRIDGYRLVLPLTMDTMQYSRIVLLVREGLEVEVLTEHMSDKLACIFVKLGQRGRKPLIVGGIYREQHLLLPGAPRGTINLTDAPAQQQDRWRRQVQCWKAASKKGKCIIVGDLNLDYTRWTDPEPNQVKMVDRVKGEIETCGFYQMVTGTTRAWPQTRDSAVDHIWSNEVERIISHSNVVRTDSDHNVLAVRVRLKDRIIPRQEIEKRMRKDFDQKAVIDYMKQVDWTDLLRSEDVDSMNGILEKEIQTALDRVAPIRTVQVRKNFKNWVDTELKSKMTDRDKLRETARRTGNPEDWALYRRSRNSVSKETKKTKERFYENMFNEMDAAKDSKKIYGLTKELLGWKSDSAPKCLLVEGKLLRKPCEIANAQLDFYEKKLNTLRGKLAPKTSNPLDLLKNALDKWDKKDEVNSFSFKEISILETSNLVSKLGNSVSYGHDGIDALSFKLILPTILIPLNHIINTSLRKGKFAMKWKLSKVIPLLKSKDSNRLDAGEYRPVSLLSTTSKVVERAAQLQLLKFFEDSGQLNNSGHAYRTGLSTTTTVAQICDELYQAAEQKNIASIMTVDQSMAFDTLSHDILVQKLELYGVGPDALEWIRDYLGNRAQYVKVGSAASKWRTMKYGVPQGSVMGPLLYSIYVNELTQAVRQDNCADASHLINDDLFGHPCEKCGGITMYSDDATYIIANKRREQNQVKLEENFGKILDFMNNNELTMNLGKTTLTECMLSQKKGRTPGPPPKLSVSTGPGVIKEIVDKGECKVLGATLQSNMSWAIHLVRGKHALLPTLKKQLGALQHLGKKVPLRCRKLIATGLILSKMTYLIPLWGSSTKNYMRKAQAVWNKTARWTTGLNRRTRTKELMVQNNWLTVQEMVRYHSTVLMWKTIYNRKPRHIFNKLDIDENYKIDQNESRLQFTRRGYRHRTTTHWNEMTEDLRTNQSIASFKKSLKSWIIDRRNQEPD